MNEKIKVQVTSLVSNAQEAYRAAIAADSAWQTALDTANVDRYSLAARGEQGSELRRLRDAKCEADRKLRKLTELVRFYQDPHQV
jgi:hypothetical protein